ncbi:hypothetical protein HPT25_07685 [Bacillus sp. BRMEA1]|uniref:hypothetical protein n=1 Tax=Neobacillus endophyticus TaxID=2738405 RepID=UPI001565CFA2|nr:hypothetical protein [Neobacillus endophyticus]NRD77379.1 hypothetical protein [Neobacillus endophyticus]
MEKDQLEKENIQLKNHIRNLQEAIGRWKRMAQDKAPRHEYLRERHDHDFHFIDVIVSDIPEDTPLHEAQKHMLETIIPKYHPYIYHACYRSKKYGWVCTLSKYDDEVDMTYLPPVT